MEKAIILTSTLILLGALFHQNANSSSSNKEQSFDYHCYHNNEYYDTQRAYNQEYQCSPPPPELHEQMHKKDTPACVIDTVPSSNSTFVSQD